MNEIITLNPTNSRFPVSARELYEKLGFDLCNWARWTKQNISDNKFAIKDQDYEGFFTMKNGNQTQDYQLSLDFAKRLAMLSRTEKGELVRNYFLEVERRFQSLNAPKTKQEVIQAGYVALLEMVEEMRPKAEYFDALVDRKLNINFRDTAKELKVKETEFIKFLEDKHYIYRDQGGKIKPYAQHVPGLFEMKEYQTPSGHSGTQTLITPRGRETFRILLN